MKNLLSFITFNGYQRSHVENHQKAELNNSFPNTAPHNIREKKLPVPLKKKRRPKRKLAKAKTGLFSEDFHLLCNKLNNVPAGESLESNDFPNMFAHRILQLKTNRGHKVLQRKLKSLTKFWQNGADNTPKSDTTDSDENQIMVNDHKSSPSQHSTLTSSTFDATPKDTLRTTTVDPGTTEVAQLCNKSVSTENENYCSTVNENSLNCSKENTDVTVEQKPLDESSQQVLNASCSTPKEDISRELHFEDQDEFEQKLTELDYHLGYIPSLALKRKKISKSFNKAKTSQKNFIKENMKRLRKMQIHLNEKRSHTTPTPFMTSGGQKAASKMLPLFPTSQKQSHKESKTSRRRMKNKMTHQKKMYLHKVPKLNLQKGGKYDSTDLDHSSPRTTLTSIHDSGCSTASGGTLRNFSADANNDQRNISYDEENLSSPGGYESPKSSKKCSDAKVMKKNVLAPESQDTLKVSSPQQRKACTESLNVKMTAKAMAARQKALAPSPPNPMKPPPSYQKGVLPKYLVARQEEQQKQLTDPDCPPGYVRLPDIERRETLRILRKYYCDLIEGMNMLPVQSPVKKIQQKKMDIEKQLEKLNAAIKVFSKSKVFMKVDNKVPV